MTIRDKEPPSEGKYLPGGDALHGREGAPPQMGIEADDGEKCWIVHSDEYFRLQRAIEAYDKRREELKQTVALGG